MTKHDVIARLKNAQEGKSLRAFAKEIGVDPAILSKIYSGEREINDTVLKFLGLKKRIEYEEE